MVCWYIQIFSFLQNLTGGDFRHWPLFYCRGVKLNNSQLMEIDCLMFWGETNNFENCPFLLIKRLNHKYLIYTIITAKYISLQVVM